MSVVSREKFTVGVDYKGLADAVASRGRRLDPAVVERLRPDISRHRTRLVLKDLHPEYANVIRAATREMIPHKMLSMDDSTENVDTNDPLVLPPVLKQRVENIRLSVRTPADAVFSVKVKNTTKDIMRVYSRELRTGDESDKKGKNPPFSGMLNLHDLAIGKYLTIRQVTVREGRGYQHEGFSLCTYCGYHCLDFIEVYRMMAYGNYETVLLDREWYERHEKLTVGSTLKRHDRKFIMVPRDMPMDDTLGRIAKNMKVVRMSDEEIDGHLFFGGSNTKSHTSVLSRWVLEAETIEDVPIFEMGIEALVGLLTKIEPVVVEVDADELTLTLHGVPALYGNAIRRAMLEDKAPFVTCTPDSNDLDICYIYVKHPDGRGLFRSAIDRLVKLYKKLLSEL